MYNKTPAKAYAVAVLREDLGLNFYEISQRMDCSPSTAGYLYKQFIIAERKGIKLLELWPKSKKKI
jgi:hypothetical protein